MKRILSIILTAVIMLSLIPMSMFSVSAGGGTPVPYTLSVDGTYYIVSEYPGYPRDVTEVVIPAEYAGLPIKAIGVNAFSEYYSLTSITIPNSVTSIGDGAFRDCSRLTSINIPDSVTSIGRSVFRGCSGLKNITVASGNKTYKSSGNCLIEIKTKTLIAGCPNSIIPTDGSVTSISNSAFYGCYSLTSINIPDSVTSIGEGAFRDCASLTSVHIPDSVTTMSDRVFDSCFRITDVYCEAESKPDGWNPGWLAGFGGVIHWGVKVEDINNELTFAIANIENSLFESDYAQDEWNGIQEAINKAKDFVTSGKSASEGEIRAGIDALQNALILNPKKAEFGDMTGDGAITSLDYLYVKRSCFGTYNLTVGQTARADINRNDKVDSADYLLVKRIAFGTYKVQ